MKQLNKTTFKLVLCLLVLSFSLTLFNNLTVTGSNKVSIPKGLQAAGTVTTCNNTISVECITSQFQTMQQAEIDKAVAAAIAKAKDTFGKTPTQIKADNLAAEVYRQASQNKQAADQAASVNAAKNSGLETLGQYYYNSPKDLLPAYRWNSFPLNITPDSGLGGTVSTSIKSVYSNLASFFFGISNLIWTIVLWIVDFVGSSSFILTLGKLIDNGYYAVATTFLGHNYKTSPINSLAFILMVFVFYNVIKRVIRGKSIAGSFKMVMTFFIAMSVMYFLATTTEDGAAIQNTCSSTNMTANCSAYTPGKFTPAWVAYQGTTTLDEIAGAIVTSPQLIKQVNSQDLLIPVGSGYKYSCEQYTGYLYSTFQKVSDVKGTKGIKTGKDGTTITAQISMLWQRAYLMLWSQANFGSSSPTAMQASCHYLEYHNGITPQEQIVIGNNSYGSGLNPSVYLLTNDSADQGYGIYPWMACQGDNIDPAWQMLFSYSENANTTGSCKSWRSNGPDKNFLHFADGADLDKAYTCAISNLSGQNFGSSSALVDCPTATPKNDSSFTSDPQAAKKLTDIRNTILTYRGNGGSNRPILGLASLASAIGLGFILGVVSLGALAASFGLILMLIWFPVTLIMLVLDSRNEGSTNGKGKKMLKFTISFMASKMVLMFALLIIVQLSVIIVTAIDLLGV